MAISDAFRYRIMQTRIHYEITANARLAVTRILIIYVPLSQDVYAYGSPVRDRAAE